MKTDDTIRIDKIKANQPSNNPFYKELMSMCNADDKQVFAAKLQRALTYENAKIAFKFSDVYKSRPLAKKVGVSHETLYKWMREYAPFLIKHKKGGAK